MPFSVDEIRRQFPILDQKIHGKPLVYLDNAASAQKPSCVLEALKRFYETDYANIHRGLHVLSQRATKQYEEARDKVQNFLNAKDRKEIIFLRGATEAVNLVAQTFAKQRINSGDRILISAMEHHSNIVPWQLLCNEVGAKLDVVQMNQKGELLLDDLAEKLSRQPQILGIVHVSNSLGTINPLKEIISMAHEQKVPVLVDGAQAVPHLSIDVQDLDCDFYVFSGHKMYGPSGIGALYGKKEHLEDMPPYHGGGEMISSVTFEKTTFADLPNKFEAGTPNIANTVALGHTIDFLQKIGLDKIASYEHELLQYGTSQLLNIPGLTLYGTSEQKAAVLSFTLKGVHPHDVGTIIDQEGVAVRAGHHCTQPVMDFFHIPATTRASLGVYNTKDDIDRLVESIKKVMEMFG